MRLHTHSSRRSRGFTLVELMVAVAIAGILLALALPSFQSTLRSNRIAAATNQLIAAVALARSEAVRNTRGSGICASVAGATCSASTDWNSGWLVWSDTNGNGTFEPASDVVLRYMQGNSGLTITGPATVDSLRFDRRGRLASNVGVSVNMQPKDCGGKPLRRTLTISSTGQVRKNGALSTCL